MDERAENESRSGRLLLLLCCAVLCWGCCWSGKWQAAFSSTVRVVGLEQQPASTSETQPSHISYTRQWLSVCLSLSSRCLLLYPSCSLLSTVHLPYFPLHIHKVVSLPELGCLCKASVWRIETRSETQLHTALVTIQHSDALRHASATDATNKPNTDAGMSSDTINFELRSRCVQGWQLHRELAAMQAALRAINTRRSVLPAGVQARPVVPRALAAPFVPSGRWHMLLVTEEYAFKCSGAERVEQLDYGDLQQGLQRKLRRATEEKLRLQQIPERNSQQHNTSSAHGLPAQPECSLTEHVCRMVSRQASVSSTKRGAGGEEGADSAFD